MTYRFVTNTSLRIVQIGLLLEAIVRGVNYLVTPSDASMLYHAAQGTMPLYVWGIMFIAMGLIGLLGELWMSYNGSTLGWDNRSWPSFISHIGLMALFAGFAASAVVGIVERGAPFYGFVTPFDFVVFSVAHWAFARRRKHA